MGASQERTAAAGGPTDAGKVLTLRPRRVLRLAWAGSVLVVALFVAIAIVLRNTDTGVYFRFADQVSMVLLGLLIAAGLLLLARPRVRADAEGVQVRNILQTRYFPWGEVMAVAFPDGASWARLDLPDDEYLPVLAVQAVDRTYAVDGIRALRALRAAAHTAPTAGGPTAPAPAGTDPGATPSMKPATTSAAGDAAPAAENAARPVTADGPPIGDADRN
ncbi:PH domain-containing protein [Pseudonocardia sp. N23]|uniref:PH domain-containing protein n=1 Tax=Pseudonocardia sp. N23 TaxID=1987376 RepID=UPI000C033432|nr:PH domain-containing protein [Pseudonocardia sp. N23]GAY12466.1 possible conserved membrane protein [Pseudonocardia sp. N23]